MTSTLPSTATTPSTAAQTASSAASGTPPPARSSYATATRGKPTGPAIASSGPPAIVGGPAQIVKSSSISPVNGRPVVPPAVPAGAPAIVSSGTILNGNDHSRKPSSVTISAQGSSGYIANGGAAGVSPRPNISFGSITASGSPAVANSVPHISHNSNLGTPAGNPGPARSPSPIPTQTVSGGRPPSGPSGPQGPGSQLNFGSLGGAEGADQSLRPNSLPQGPANLPQPQHLRRESSQSAHSDMSAGMNRNFVPNNARGRGYPPSYPAQSLSHSPNVFRPGLAMQPRNSSNVPPFQTQAPMRPNPNSPYQSNRSPAVTNAMPHQPHMGNGPPMQHPYGGGYPQHLNPQSVKPPSHSRQFLNSTPAEQANASGQHGHRGGGDVVSSSFSFPNSASTSQRPLPDFTVNGSFEQYLTYVKGPGMYGVPHQQFDPYNSFYPQNFVPSMPGMQYPAPPSPRPFNASHGPQQPYMPGPYNGPSQGMSRSSSHGPERPASSVGQPQTPSQAPQTPAPISGSPAPSSSTFARPEPRKSKAIVIKTADGAVVDLKNISSTTPVPQTRPPAVVSSGAGVPSTSTPPPRAAASTPQHTRNDSSAAKTAEETKREFNEQFKRQLEKEQAENSKKKDDEDKAKVPAEKPKEAEAKEPAQKVEEAKPEDKVEAAKGETDEEKAARIKKEEEEEQERWIAELEEQERQEEEREKAYAAKKAEEKAKKEAEAAARLDEDLKRAEREAEALEEAKLKNKAEGDDAGDKAESDKLFATLKRPTFGPGATASTSGTSTPEAMAPPVVPAAPVATAKTPTLPKQKPAALKLETNKTVEPAQPTAGMQSLRSARMLQLQSETVSYPEGIKSPNPALNQGSKSKGRQYDKNFLMQFQEVFKEKPSVDWDKMLKDTVGDSSDSARPQSARTPSMGGRQASRSSVPSGTSFGPMGTFNTGTGVRSLPPGTTSAERFAASQGQPTVRPGPAISNPFASFAGRPGGAFPMGTGAPVMARTSSSQSLQQGMNSPRNASSRGRNSRRGPTAQQEAQLAKAMPLTAGTELKPLELSRTGWKPISITGGGSTQPLPSGQLAPDLVQRKVKAALNKMTPEKFEKISMDILEIAGQSKNETDGRTLRQVIQLTFEKATDEAHWASMYAKFCKRMLETMSTDIKDENVKDKNGAPVVGGGLFRKYLLNRCQEEFERGWEVNLPTRPEGQTEEAVMLSDEYYIAAAAKRRGLGLIQFIGELYKLGMLTVRIMHECVMKLLNFEGLPDESAIESLVKLLRTVGGTMDANPSGHGMIGAYFERIEGLMKMEGLPSRLYYMLLDTVDLRSKNWRSKDEGKGPMTISELHEVEMRKAQQADLERQRSNARGGPGGRPPAGRGDARSFSQGNMQPPPDYHRNTVQMDDLKKLTRSARSANQGSGLSLGPSSMLGSRSNSGRKGLGPLSRGADDSGASSRTGTPPVKEKESAAHVNAYSALASLDASGEGADDVASPPSTASSPALAKSIPAKDKAGEVDSKAP